MNCVDEFRSREVTAPLVKELHNITTKPVRIMEVCGTHTMSIFRHGIRSLLPENITLLSGPGCPVCVTPASHIDAFIAASKLPDTAIATFGDLVRVPGSVTSLGGAREKGARVEIVYSPMDAVTMAAGEPQTMFVFPAIGFETTAPTIAASVLQAQQLELDNFTIISACKTIPLPLDILMSDPELDVDGLLCPGHVSAIIGADVYRPLAEKYNLSCAVAGFEPADILSGILSLVKQINSGSAEVTNCYTRAVDNEGNQRALELINRVFKPEDSEWRGLGTIPQSGLGLRDEYKHFDALHRLPISFTEVEEPKGCACGEILKGRILPPQCPLYAKRCTPLNPIGPCMVSGEGTCAAYYRYSDKG